MFLFIKDGLFLLNLGGKGSIGGSFFKQKYRDGKARDRADIMLLIDLISTT